MKEYLNLVQRVMDRGFSKGDRTGTGTISSFGERMEFNLQEEFPIIKAKFTAFRPMAEELLWFLRGSTNKKELQEKNVHIWDEWGNDETGEMGPIYGYQWRKWDKHTVKSFGEQIDHADGSTTFTDAKVTVQHVDQIKDVIERLKKNPDDRRLIVSAWNVADIPNMALPPCHSFFQFYSRKLTQHELFQQWTKKHAGMQTVQLQNEVLRLRAEEGISVGQMSDEDAEKLGLCTRVLDCQLYQRSADIGLGVPFNIVSYALLTHMVAQVVDMIPGRFVHIMGDAHIYQNHVSGLNEMMSREPINQKARIWLNPDIKNIDDFSMSDIKLLDYAYHPKIVLEVAV